MSADKFLEGYSGQSVDELIASHREYRVDSIVLAFEGALLAREEREGLHALNEPELTILAVESLEREVNNGGYHQFFFNTPQHAPSIVAALERIGCPVTAKITAAAIARVGLRPPFTAKDVEAALARDPEGKLVEVLSDECDGAYFEQSSESIADRLFEYIRANRGSIRLKGQ